MSQAASSSAAVVGALFEAFAERDEQRFLELVAPRFVLDWSRSISPRRGTYDGRDEVLGFLRAAEDVFEEVRWEAKELAEVAPGKVVARVELAARGRASSAEVTGRGAHVWHVRDGQAVSCTLYQTHAEALAAACG